jgi:hypothetical protein
MPGSGVWIWGAALLLYGGFSLWYNNLRGALGAEEVERFVERARATSNLEPDRLAALRRFLEADDGGEFFMLNLIKLQPGPVPRPGSGEPQPARKVLAGYTDHFMPALFARAGHPALLGQAAGGYLEHWGVEPDLGWTFAGVIRYRSRRDMIELATHPDFEPAHVYKLAAMASTLAFPLRPATLVAGPRVWLALALALLAALAQLVLQSVRPGT